jgi:hypothetical protein
MGGFWREVQHPLVLGFTRKRPNFPSSSPSAVFRRCEGGSVESKIEQLQSVQALRFASELRHLVPIVLRSPAGRDNDSAGQSAQVVQAAMIREDLAEQRLRTIGDHGLDDPSRR